MIFMCFKQTINRETNFWHLQSKYFVTFWYKFLSTQVKGIRVASEQNYYFRSVFHFFTPENIRKPLLFRYLQEVKEKKIELIMLRFWNASQMRNFRSTCKLYGIQYDLSVVYLKWKFSNIDAKFEIITSKHFFFRNLSLGKINKLVSKLCWP